MIIDCDTCCARGSHCTDCVVTVILGGPARVELDVDAHRALTVLAEGGMVPPLRMVPVRSSRSHETAEGSRAG